MTKPYHSMSRVGLLLRCGEAYRRRYIENEILPPGVAMARGTAVHKAAADNYRQKIESHQDLSVNDILDAASASFDAAVAAGVLFTPDEEAAPKVVLGRAKDQAVRMARVYAEQEAPEYQPLLVEEKIRRELPGTHDLLGVLDLVDVRGVVADRKTTAKRKSQAEADRSLQLSMQASLAQSATGEWPKELRLEVLVDGTRGVERQVVRTYRDASDMAALAATLNVVADSVQKGVFLPAPEGSWQCSARWCGYYSTCPYVRRTSRPEAPPLISGAPLPKRRRKLTGKEITAALKDQPRCRCGVLLTAKTAEQDPEHELRLVCRACATERQIIPLTPEV